MCLERENDDCDIIKRLGSTCEVRVSPCGPRVAQVRTLQFRPNPYPSGTGCVVRSMP